MPDKARLAAIKAVIFDVDGVLTNGRLNVDTGGEVSHLFHVRDGLAFVTAWQQGLKVGIISGRRSSSVSRRLRELRVTHIHQGIGDKATCFHRVCDALGEPPSAVAFTGDDINDLPALALCGLPCTVQDGVEDVRNFVRGSNGWVLSAPGGGGAARELMEAILAAQGRWPTYATGRQP